ncbi:MAG: hypothetical protein IKF36_00795 [Bacilli bacterium]|nr:hypothetical protein [Bacilli bacterium]
MKNYSLDNESDFILGYKKKDNKIIVRLPKRRKFEVFNSKENEDKIIKKMEHQVEYGRLYFESDRYENIDKTIVKVSPYLLLHSPTSIITYNFWGNNFVYKIWIGLFILEAGLFGMAAFSHYGIKYYKKDFEKNILFLKNKDDINSFIEENPSCLDDLNKKARIEIEDRIVDSEEPININTVNKLKLKELKSLLEKVNFNRILEIESASDVLEKEKTDLIDKYESKKMKLTSN